MKKKTLLFLLLVTASYSLRAQSSVTGRVLSELDSTAVGGVSIVNSIDGNVLTKTDNDGVFKINNSKGIESLILSHIAYQMDTVRLTQTTGRIVVYLQPDSHVISEIVVSTGYESLNTRKTTGSYTLVNNELLNRSVTPDILSRLEGVTNSLSFTRKDLVGERERTPELRVRGKSTIHGDGSPLIVLDNFPYEGQLNSINPNDIQDITILKDAAAAAIWGARAGNGVIVINTKKGGINRRPVVSFNSNVTIGERPNLLYSPLFMDAADFLEVEKELYRRGFFDNPDDRTVLSPVVEMLIKDGETPSTATKAAMDKLAEIDFRNEASRLFYQQKVNQQYAVNFQGGADRFGYYISGGYDANRVNIKRNSDNRVTLLTQFNVKLTNKLEVNLGLNLVASQVAANGLGLTSMVSSGKAALLPYTTFLDEAGVPAVINHNYRQLYVDNAEAMGLLNWQYRPLEEQALGNSVSKATESRANAAISYQIVPSIRLDAKYQYHRILNDHATNFHESSFYARDLVNRFTQQDGTQIIPKGAVLEGSNSETTDHAFRTQANIDKTLNGMHEITGLMGFEMRQTKTIGSPGYLLYGVDNDILVGKNRLDYSIAHSTRPQGRALIPAPQTAQRYLIDRYLSYYANISYLYGGKYGFSASARQDGSNLFGVKYNQKFVPLWSAGFAWIVSEESFVDWGIDTFLKLRATYGYSGNVDKSATAFPTATYSADPRSGLLSAIIRSPGNPSLRWEKVQTLNFGTDFSVLSGRLAGSVDYYVKRGLDLIGDDVSDPTTGLGFPALQGGTLSNRINYANTKTKGLDVEVTSENLRGKFRWSTALLANYVNNLITTYRGTDDPNILAYTVTTGPISPMEGRPIDPLYSLPWYGLNPDDGSPLVRVDGTLSNQYGQFINQLTHADLILSGSSIPKWFGSIRNTFGWGDLSLSFNISWKSGYYFRPSSIDYNSLFSQWLGHRDFADRWLKPGDEKFTNVPSMPSLETYDASGRMDLVYTRSNILVEKGDHLRLRDINVNYTFHKSTFRRLPFQSMILTLYMQNLGILWRANSKGIDPDVPNASYPNPTAYAVGLNVNLNQLKMTTKHIFIFFAVAACMCISCEDFLEIKPDKSIVVPDRLEDFQALLDNNAIMNAGTGHQLGEISGDNYFISRVAWENLTNAFQRNAYVWEKEIFEGELSTDWNNPSLVILYSNLALEGAAKITRDDRNFNEWNNLKGSALFFRAYAFYQLAQLFCDTYKSSSASQDLGIPLRLESDITLPSVRATIERTYRQIVADVTEASTLLPVVPVFKTRPSKPASHAFLARVFLQMGDYENALLHANLSLDDFNSLMDYNSIDATDNFPFVPYNDEVIFHSHMSSPAILNQSRLQVADELLKAYEADDLRKTCFFRENNGSIVYRGSYYGSNAFFTGLSSNEVFMIAAECNARIGDVPQALECLNALLASRYRAGTLVAIEETDPQLLLDIILAERRKELPFRGLRWSDLKRLNLDSRYAKTLERIWENEAVVLEPNSPRYIFPIPDAVIDISGIEQNKR